MRSLAGVVAAGLVCGAASMAQAGILAGWNFNGITPGGVSPMAATTVDAALNTPMLTRVGLGGGDATNFGANKFTIGGDGSMVTATTPNLAKYLSFTITPLGSNVVTVDSVSLNAGMQDNSAATMMEIRSSADAFAAPALQTVLDGINGSESLYQAPLSATVDASHPLEVRIYMYGAANGYETGAIGLNAAGDGLDVNGTAGAVPEPASLGLLGLGALALLRRRR